MSRNHIYNATGNYKVCLTRITNLLQRRYCQFIDDGGFSAVMCQCIYTNGDGVNDVYGYEVLAYKK